MGLRLYSQFFASIHAPARGATPPAISRPWAMPTLQSTLPRGERLLDMDRESVYVLLQSTLPRGERRTLPDSFVSNSSASIHAPARGATSVQGGHPDEGRRASIHAPARGATRSGLIPSRNTGSFNPRSRAGSDGAAVGHVVDFIKLQSTLPRGERHAWASNVASWWSSFNPRSRAGSDPKAPSFAVPGRLQSTLPRGERRFGLAFWPLEISLQSTLPRGERPAYTMRATSGRLASIHAPARGATCSSACRRNSFRGFNPRSRAGSDSACRGFDLLHSGLQSTLPRGERPGGTVIVLPE